MTQYLIHAYPKRMWYVEQYLIPSLINQGIVKDQIKVYNDIDGDGNLKACMKAFASCEGEGGTWHLQDDVCVCKQFRELTEKYDEDLVAGFSSGIYDGGGNIGKVRVEKMWFSFPCIRIPNSYARECSYWVNKFIIGNPVYRDFWKDGKNDDWAFRAYMREFHRNDIALNIAPNLVDHVDYLLGGGSGGTRKFDVRAQYWIDDDIVKELEDSINGMAYKQRNGCAF